MTVTSKFLVTLHLFFISSHNSFFIKNTSKSKKRIVKAFFKVKIYDASFKYFFYLPQEKRRWNDWEHIISNILSHFIYLFVLCFGLQTILVVLNLCMIQCSHFICVFFVQVFSYEINHDHLVTLTLSLWPGWRHCISKNTSCCYFCVYVYVCVSVNMCEILRWKV